MNLLTFREHHVYQSDACERGLGGYSASGRAWRWEIPTHLQGRAHINLLEFIAAIVGIWIDIIEGAVVPESCILSMGDNTSATGWLKKSNFKETDEMPAQNNKRHSQRHWEDAQPVRHKPGQAYSRPNHRCHFLRHEIVRV